MNWLEVLDRDFVLFVNGFHSPFLDEFMWFFSQTISLLPLFLLVFFFLFKEYAIKEFLLIFVLFALSLFLTDFLSVHLFKEVFQRLRPSHNPIIQDYLHYYKQADGTFYRGGDFGFISSHSANYFGLFAFLFPFFYNKRNWLLFLLFFIGLIVVISRIYLGVHYFSDIAAGAAFGALIGSLIYLLFLFLVKNSWKYNKDS